MDAERWSQEHSRWNMSSLAIPQYRHLLLNVLSSLCSRDFCSARVFISCSWIAKIYPSTWDDIFGSLSQLSESSWFLSSASTCFLRTKPCCFIEVHRWLWLSFNVSRAFLANVLASSSFTAIPSDSCSREETRKSLSFSCRFTSCRNMLLGLAFSICIVVDIVRTTKTSRTLVRPLPSLFRVE